MNNTNVAATKSTGTVSLESPSLLRVWWMKTELRYNIAMNSFVIILNIAAILYMKINKIPSEVVEKSLPFFVGYYVLFGIISCGLWIMGIKKASVCKDAYFKGRWCHNCGFAVFLHLLYCISPRLALFVGLHFALPYWLWCIAAAIGPSLREAMQALRDWWKFVSQPQPYKS